jgi:hypothetical protein
VSKYAPQNWSQRNQRREGGQFFRDQHGRRYHAEIELKTGHPCGPLVPSYRAPLVVPQQYLTLSNDPENPTRLTINYTAWESDARAARRDWEQEGRSRALKMYGDAYDPRKPFGQDVLDIIGPAPSAVEPIIAARQGNSWVLGLSDRIDLRLAKYFEPEQLDPQYRPAEPDFTDLSDVEDEPTALEQMDDEEEARKERVRAQDRARKAAKRAAQKAQTLDAATAA